MWGKREKRVKNIINVSSVRRLNLFAEIENKIVAWQEKSEFLLWMYLTWGVIMYTRLH